LFFEREIPTDILLQLHVAVANVGGRKGVLSGLYLDALLDADGNMVKIHRMPFPMSAHVARQTTRYVIGKEGFPYREFLNEIGGPPLVLEPDDVVTLRFRARRGINWADGTLEEIKNLASSLSSVVTKARVRAVYRRGKSVETHSYIVECSTVGQDKYVARIKELTKDLTSRPNIPKQFLELED